MREFLSRNRVPFEERNVARDPGWRAELMGLAGDLVVPVTAARGSHLVGFDEPELRRLLDLAPLAAADDWPALHVPAEVVPVGLEGAPPELRADLVHLLARIQAEMEYNAAKGRTAYRQGQHDAMRFARDALKRVVSGRYERKDLLADQARAGGDDSAG